MPLDAFLLDLLEDPIDHEALLYVPSKDVLFNPRRKVAYEVRDSIPVLLPDEATSVSDEEHERYSKDPLARPTGTKT